MNTFAYNRKLKSVSRTHLLHGKNDRRARLSLHPVTALLGLKALGRLAVNRYDFISAHKTVLMRRRAEIWLIDDHVVLFLLVDDGTDSSVCLRQHHLKVLVLFLRDIDSIRIQFLKHGVHAGPHDPVYRERVYIRTVQFLQYGMLYLGPLTELEAMRLRRYGQRGHEHG